MDLKTSFHRFLTQKMAVLGSLILLTLIVIALFAPYITPHDPNRINYTSVAQPPSLKYLLGTDAVGRDVLSRIIMGSRISLIVGFLAVSFSVLVGLILGILSGYFGGWIDDIIMRLVDVFLAFPLIVLAIGIVTVIGPGFINLVIALGLTQWTQYARIVRGEVLIQKELEYIEAAKALGVSQIRIMIKYIIPNTLAPVIVLATLNMGTAIIAEAGLSFLGLGIQPPNSSWGTILSGGRSYLRQAPHITTFAGLAIMITVMAFNFLGDGLRDLMDPRLKK